MQKCPFLASPSVLLKNIIAVVHRVVLTKPVFSNAMFKNSASRTVNGLYLTQIEKKIKMAIVI